MSTSTTSAAMSQRSSPNVQLTDNQAEIVAMCADSVEEARHNLLLFETRIVKFDTEIIPEKPFYNAFTNIPVILNEGDTQAFVYEAFKSLPGAPRVPEVYECFAWDGVHYLVTEKVDLPTVEAWVNDTRDEAEKQSRFDQACQVVASALRFLFTLSPSDGAEVGLIEGAYARTQSKGFRAKSGCARHPFFGEREYDAPFRYTSAFAFQKHIRTVLTYPYRPKNAPRIAIKIANEPLVMVHGDIRPCNFLIDPKTLQVTITGFSYVSALPHSFVDFTLHNAGNEFVAGIAKSLDWAQSKNLPALKDAASTYRYTAGNDLGLDKDGLPVTHAWDRPKGGRSGPRRKRE